MSRIILLGFLISTIYTDELKITRTHKPSCQVDTNKGTLDLSSLSHTDGTYRASVESSVFVIYILWNPCKEFTVTSSNSAGINSCNEVEACLVMKPKGDMPEQDMSLGRADDGVFHVSKGQLMLTYKAKSESPDVPPGTIETTNILMVCNQTAKDTFIVSDDSFNNEMTLTLTSPIACLQPPGNLEAGYIILITIIGLLCVYCLVGSLVNRFCFGSTGLDILPGINLWKRICGRLKCRSVFEVDDPAAATWLIGPASLLEHGASKTGEKYLRH